MGEPKPQHLGELLVSRGLVTEAELAGALARHKQVGVPLGAVLLSRGLISRRQLYQALGELWDVGSTDLGAIDKTLLHCFSASEMAQEGWAPVRAVRNPDGSYREIQVAVAGRLEDDVRRKIQQRTAAALVTQVVATDWDVRRVVRDNCAEELVVTASEALAMTNPEASARRVLTLPQIAFFALALGALSTLAAFRPHVALVLTAVLVDMLFTITVLFKLLVSLVGAAKEHHQEISQAEVDGLDEADLPLFTVLVPVYHEENVIGSLMSNLSELDYPREKLEILLLLEADDPQTLAAAKAAAPPDVVKFVIVPEGGPRTKPKACNVGLMFARGEYLVIYDAEDRPEPDQLKKVVAAFRKGGPDLVCVQAALNYFNAEENLLTRMFTLEYSYWFDYMLPGLDALGLPIPLGGTSNHFRTEMLRELGGWDPYNVTEDADLGIRAAALGGRVRVVNSTTYEEANKEVRNWARQRSRWIKGYIQTVLVHTRHPVRLVRRTGLRQAFGFALLVGGTPLSFLVAPPLWALFLMSVFAPRTFAGLFPQWLAIANMLTLLGGNAIIVYLNMLAVFKRRHYHLIWFSVLNPLYWVLHSIASYQALWQLMTGRASFWEKTVHGLTNMGPAPPRVPDLSLGGGDEVPSQESAASPSAV